MPVLRYFVFVGGALLALLFVSNAYLPKMPDELRVDTGLDKSVIRIHSDRKWPERVVFDTNQPTVIPAPAANTIARVEVPAKQAGIAADTRMRNSFAQLQTADQNAAESSEPTKPEKTVQRKRKVAKRRAAPPVMLVAQQPQFSLFGNNTW